MRNSHRSSKLLFALTRRASMMLLQNAMRRSKQLRRTSSAPQLHTDDDHDIDQHARVNTVGNPGTASPTAYAAVGNMHWNLCMEPISVDPELVTEIWEGRMYVIMNWRPQERRRGMMRAELWHSTLGMWWVTADITSEEVVTGVAEIRHKIERMYHALKYEVTDPQYMSLGAPPWARSWNFGITGQWLNVMEAVQVYSELVTSEVQWAVLRERRPIHISWH